MEARAAGVASLERAGVVFLFDTYGFHPREPGVPLEEVTAGVNLDLAQWVSEMKKEKACLWCCGACGNTSVQ